MPPCVVHVLDAPADVRAEIERWVAAEPSCDRELEVHVVAGKDGNAVTALDEHGHAFARVVPDATSVAVLVVSWMADAPPAPPAPLSSVVIPSVSLPEALDGDEETISLVARSSTASAQRLAVGLIATDDGAGIRGQLDLYARRRWSIGIAGSHSEGGHGHGESAGNIYLAGTFGLGHVSLRAQLGFGVDTQMDHMRGMVVPAIEASALIDVPVWKNIGIVGGPVVDVPLDGDPGVAAFFGLRYQR
jgi:hypothetical protein